MPLKDRDKKRPRRLQRLGIIRLGIKVKAASGYEYPKATDYFVLTDAPDIAEVYGDKPRELDVLFPFPDIPRNFDAAYTVWGGGVLICRGDGEFVEHATPHKVSHRTNKDGKKLLSVKNAPGGTLVSHGVAKCAFTWGDTKFQTGDHVACPGEEADAYPHCKACKISAILKVMMAKPDLFRLGYYQISTGSGRNYDTILAALELLHDGLGAVSGVPCKLRLVQEPSTYMDDSGMRKKTKNWYLHLESDQVFTRTMYANQAMAALANIGQAPAPQLEAGYEEADFEEYDAVDETAPPPISEVEREVDVQTGEILSPETPPEPESVKVEEKPADTKENGPMVRPLDPAQLRTALLKKAGYTVEDGIVVSAPKNDPLVKEAAKGLRGLVTGTMNEIFKGQEDPDAFRHSILKYVFGYDSSSELHVGEAAALRAWMLGDDNELGTLAVKEAWGAIREIYLEAGQMELLPEAEQTMAQFEQLGKDRAKAQDALPTVEDDVVDF